MLAFRQDTSNLVSKLSAGLASSLHVGPGLVFIVNVKLMANDTPPANTVLDSSIMDSELFASDNS